MLFGRANALDNLVQPSMFKRTAIITLVSWSILRFGISEEQGVQEWRSSGTWRAALFLV